MDKNFLIPDHDLATLKLSLLKEHFDFQEFYKKLDNDPYSICPELRKPEEKNDQDYQFRIDLLDATGVQFFGGYAKKLSHLGVYDKFFPMVQKNGEISTYDILSLLNPQKDISDVSCPELSRMLPFLFYSSGVELYELGSHSGPFYDQYGNRFSKKNITINLYSWEKLIKIDLRIKKSRLIEELKRQIDKFYKLQEAAIGVESCLRKEDADHAIESAYQWKPDKSRDRIKESWKQLEVWKLRNQGISFPEIASRLGLADKNHIGDRTKQMYYAIYEKITGAKYNKDIWIQLLEKTLKKTLFNENGQITEDTNIWDRYLTSEETKQQELIIGKRREGDTNFTDSDDGDLYDMTKKNFVNQEQGNSMLRLVTIIHDINASCEGCQDTRCCAEMKEAFQENDFDKWKDPCDKIRKLLYSYRIK